MSYVCSSEFRPLYRIAWYLSFAMLLLIPAQIVVYVVSPPPVTIDGFFMLFQKNPFLGLLSLDFLYLFNNAIIAVIYLALFTLLWKERPVTVLLALTFGLIGIATYYPSNPAFEMLSLSSKYVQAPAAQLDIYLAAGETLLAGYVGTSFNVYYVLSTICLLLFSNAILRSQRFSKATGRWGFVSGCFMIIPSTAGTLGMIFSFLSLIPWVVFIVLLMIHFRGIVTTEVTS